MQVFVYGTLMQGQVNHDGYLNQSLYKGQAYIKGYALYDLGSYPGVIAEEGQKVFGEVYEVDQKTLKRLDWLEDEGDLYQRVVTTAYFREDLSAKVYVYLYLKPVREKDKVLFKEQPWKQRI